MYVLGGFNNWEVDPDYFLKRHEDNDDSVHYWITISGLTPGEENAFQYLVDGAIRIGDPYSDKILVDTLDYLKRLNVNAIGLMPVNEFEGKSGWGYNPSFYFAPDKYYGTKNDLKAFIDACHRNGRDVIMDIVLNHSFGQYPLVRLCYDSGKPASENPWYNSESNFANPDAHWGYDFNHESQVTQALVDEDVGPGIYAVK